MLFGCCLQVAQRFDCLAVTLEMPFKDTADFPDPVQVGGGGTGLASLFCVQTQGSLVLVPLGTWPSPCTWHSADTESNMARMWSESVHGCFLEVCETYQSAPSHAWVAQYHDGVQPVVIGVAVSDSALWASSTHLPRPSWLIATACYCCHCRVGALSVRRALVHRCCLQCMKSCLC